MAPEARELIEALRGDQERLGSRTEPLAIHLQRRAGDRAGREGLGASRGQTRDVELGGP
jgi:hypothetical protein